MFTVCLDLEGVLIPEVWVNVAEKTGIEKLKLTTRDIQDYDELMTLRLEVLKEHGLTLPYIQEVIGTLKPMDGAVEFLAWLREKCQVVILSDTFEEFALPFMRQLNMPCIFCHNLDVDDKGNITNYNIRIKDPKKKAVEAFKGLNYKIIAAGDSYNDTTMLKEADRGIFYCPPESIAAEFPQFPVARDYEAFKVEILKAMESLK